MNNPAIAIKKALLAFKKPSIAIKKALVDIKQASAAVKVALGKSHKCSCDKQ